MSIYRHKHTNHMSKKTIKLSESQLKDAIRESIEKVLNEEAVLKLPSINSTEYNQMRCLNEMAQVNKNERGLNKKASFDANLLAQGKISFLAISRIVSASMLMIFE